MSRFYSGQSNRLDQLHRGLPPRRGYLEIAYQSAVGSMLVRQASQRWDLRWARRCCDNLSWTDRLND